MKSEVKVYTRENGEVQRVQVVRLDDWSQLDFLCPRQDGFEHQMNALDCFYDIYYQQIDFGLFELYLPNGILIAVVATPCNMQYGKDILLIKEICRQLAYRYEIR